MSNAAQKEAQYQEVEQRIAALVAGEDDIITVMATVVCELHNGFDYFHWTGFYRVVAPGLLKVGPYQGGHGCLQISFDRGVCGAAARTASTQLVPDVNAIADHIACSTTTQSEIVLPVFNGRKELIAVFDVDSDLPASFDELDQHYLERILLNTFAPF